MPTVLITGAASGIGRATARRLAGQGWQCVLLDRNADALAALVPTLPAPRPAGAGQGNVPAQAGPGADPAQAAHLAVSLDLTDTAAFASLADRVPPLDVLINNAGMSDSRGIGLAEQTPQDQAALVALNLQAPAALVRALTPRLGPGARVINVSSGAGLRAIPWRGMYSPTKAGLIAQTRALAAAHPAWSVVVLCPGFVRTELVDGLISAGRLDPTTAVARIPLGRMADPDELAAGLAFLATAGAGPLRGSVLSLDGGASIFSGGIRFDPSTFAPLPLDAPADVRVVGEGRERWAGLQGTGAHASQADTRRLSAQASATAAGTDADAGDSTAGAAAGYPAVIDVSALTAPSIWQAVHEAAARFAASQTGPASLTVLVPRVPADAPWEAAGDAGAAQMLIATLACELGARALRINALEIGPDDTPDSLRDVLHYMAGASAQYLTGQTWRTTGEASDA